MTTSCSPEHRLRAQARRIVSLLKAAKPTDFGGREDVKIGIVMDDKKIFIHISRELIRTSTSEALEEYVLRLMRGETTTQ